MKLDSLKLINYRSYQEASFKFAKSVAIIGKNGSGKTNLIEAIRLLSIQRPYRAKKQEEVIAFNAEQAGLYAKANIAGKDTKINILIDRNTKQVKINQKTQKISQAVGHLKTVLFAPDENTSLFRAPSQRRKYIDALISQKNKIYLHYLMELRLATTQRNALLYLISRNEENEGNLDFWDGKVVDLSGKIQKEREATFSQINQGLNQKYQEISGQKQANFIINYNPSKTTLESIKKKRYLDIKYQTTSQGAHHDEISFILNENPLELFGSRGEQRSAIIALKHKEIELLKSKENNILEKPILLLDDIFSELDEKRQKNILSIIESQQTILTATAINPDIKKYCQQIIIL